MEEEQNNEVKSQTTTTPVERKGFNITSMVLGIISIVTFLWWYMSVPSAVIAIVFSVAGRKDAGRGMGIAGMVLGIVSLCLFVLVYSLAIFGFLALANYANL